MNSIKVQLTVQFIVLMLLQVLVLNHINFLDSINPYLYILFVLLYPVKNNRMGFIFLSFLLGLSIDVFSDSGGIHAAATLTIAYIRPVVLKLFFGVAYAHQAIKFQQTGQGNRLMYIVVLTIIHHLILFSLEVFNGSEIILILKKTLSSGIFTILLCFFITILFTKKSK